MIHQVALNTPNAKIMASCCHFLAKKTEFLGEAVDPRSTAGDFGVAWSTMSTRQKGSDLT